MNRSFRAAGSASPGRTLVTKEADEELALFLEMRKQEKERNNLLSHTAGELEPPSGSKSGTAPVFKIASSVPLRKPGIDDFLNSDGEKNDYDWLLTPPGTPLFPSLDTESKKSPPIGSIGTPKTHPTVPKSRLANAPDSSRSTLAPRQPASTSVGIRRPSSSGGPSHNSSRPATPTGRLTVPATSRQPASSSVGPRRPSTPPSRTIPSKTSAPTPTRSSTPVRSSAFGSSTPTSRPSVPAANKPASRSATPTRRTSTPSAVPASSAPTGRSSSVTRSGPTISSPVTRSGPTISSPVTRSGPTISKSSPPSHGSSPAIKTRALKPSDIPGFSPDAPPNLRTSLPERPSSVSRGRPGAPSSRSSSVEPGPNVRPRRQSCSPSRGRAPNGTVHKGGSVPPPSRSQASGADSMNPVVIGNKMVERIVNMRRLAPPKQDDQRSTQNNLSSKTSLSPDSAGFGRSLSKKSLDMALRHMDIRRSVPNSLRPLMANIPASSVYPARSGSTRSRAISVSDSPLATSSTASSEQSVNNNMICLDGSEIEDDLTSERRRYPPAFSR